MSDIYIPLYIASMKEAYQLELKTIKTIPKTRGKQDLWAEENESKQECLKVGLFHGIRNFQHKKKSRAEPYLCLCDFTFFTPLGSWSHGVFLV